jgi:CRISPR/Cas system-associated exonuclease Cas4 (RecB family)
MLAIRDDECADIDFKSGKVRPYDDDHGQLHLSAAMVMSVLPPVNKVTASYLFLDHKQTQTMTLTRADLQKEIDYFNEQYDIVNTDGDFDPKKNQYCGFCKIKEDCPIYKR